MSERPRRMPVRRYLQRRVVAAETLVLRERWMLGRLPGGPAAVLGLSVLVAVGVAVLGPDLGELTVLTGAALLALFGAAMLSQSSGILIALVVVPVALALPRDAVLVPRVVAAAGLLLLIVGIPRAQRWFAVVLVDSPRGRDAGAAGLAIASGVTVGLLVSLWGFVVPPMVRGAAITDPADLTMSPLPVLALGSLAAGLAYLIALTVQTRAGVAPDVPLLAGPVGLDREAGDPRLTDPTDDAVRDQLRHLAGSMGALGVLSLNAEAVGVAVACPADGDLDAAPRIEELFERAAATGTDADASTAGAPPTTRMDDEVDR